MVAFDSKVEVAGYGERSGRRFLERILGGSAESCLLKDDAKWPETPPETNMLLVLPTDSKGEEMAMAQAIAAVVWGNLIKFQEVANRGEVALAKPPAEGHVRNSHGCKTCPLKTEFEFPASWGLVMPVKKVWVRVQQLGHLCILC